MRWVVALFVCVLLALAAYPKEAASKPTQPTDHEIASALNNLATALHQTQKTAEHDEPCPGRNDDRSSSLCAQWKAADEAQRSADETIGLGILGSLIAAATLVAAIAAARFAKKAADHTERAADAALDALDHQRDTSLQQLRPYVFIDEATVDIPLTAKSRINLKIKNVGLSAATNIESALGARLVDRPILEQARDIVPTHWEQMEGIGPHSDIIFHMPMAGFEEEDFVCIRSGKSALITTHWIRYQGVGMCDVHKVTFYIDKVVLQDGSLMVLNEWARYESHLQPRNHDGPS